MSPMSPMGSDEIREAFLGFFERHGHRRIAGAPLVPVGDPTLLFTNAGMAPLKKYFTGELTPPAADLCDVQGCVRTTDIDDVGDRHHITYFEMLGSWSIDGYFKERAIELAYELLTGELRLDPDRLYVTVFAGDQALGLPPDEESAVAWERAGVPRDRIVALPAEDNFWGPAGASGPCGPCTEVFLDTGERFGPAYRPGGPFDTRGRYIEIWNAGVFMAFDKGLDGVLRPLPFTSVDTGSGLERLQLALCGLDSVHDTDLLAPAVRAVREALGETGEPLRHHRVIADHLRAAVAIMSEGVRPGNEGRGYIPRRLIRRCVTLAMGRGHDRLPFEPVVDAVVDRMARHHPEWRDQRSAVLAAIGRECDEFGRTVRRGLDQLDRITARHGEVGGADAFRLLATYGLPVEITAELTRERGARFDRADFDAALARHRDLSRGGGGTERWLRSTDVLPATLSSAPATEFVGYDTLAADARVVALFTRGAPTDRVAAGRPATTATRSAAGDEIDGVHGGDADTGGGRGVADGAGHAVGHGAGVEADLIVDRTPFYGEGGGQVGDRGTVTAPGGRADVVDTVVHDSGRHLHRVRVTSGELRVGDTVRLSADAGARAMTAANHTATHLLNAALRRVLGGHVRQAGSLVEPERLRFDFTHHGPLSATEIAEVERLVNSWVLADAPRRVEVMAPGDAVAAGAVSLDGERYGDAVRVLSFGDFTKELCGGTHVPRTSVIGSFRVLSEQSVASGVRRIVAVTRERAIEHSIGQGSALAEIGATLRVAPRDVPAAVHRVSAMAKAERSGVPAEVTDRQETVVDGLPVVIAETRGTARGVREEALRLGGDGDRAVLAWTTAGEKATLVATVPERYGDRLDARVLVREAARRLGGSGGGNARIAQGGLTSPPTAALLTEVLAASLTASAPG